MDFVTGPPKSVSGLDAILVMVDKRTKMAHFAAYKTTCDAEQTAKLFVHNVVRLHGMPQKILRRSSQIEDPNSQVSSQKQCCRSWVQGRRSRLPITHRLMVRQNA